MIDIIISVVIGIAWGWWAREQSAKKHVEKLFAEHLESPIEQDDETLFVKVEKHDNVYYLYTAETDEFVAQGSTLDEIREVINKRYKGKKRIAIAKGEDKGLLS